jgi:hypothetical protein
VGGPNDFEARNGFFRLNPTVCRVVKAALEPGEYERIKEQRSRRAASASPSLEAAGTASIDALVEPSTLQEAVPDGHSDVTLDDPGMPSVDVVPALDSDSRSPGELSCEIDAASSDPQASSTEASPPSRRDHRRSVPKPQGPKPHGAASGRLDASQEDGPAVLAIDDADDFGDDESDDDDLMLDPDGDFPEVQAFVPVPLLEFVDDHTEIRPLPLTAADLPGSAWMLVDKTVELQARPLSEFTELGRLPVDEQDRQALMVFVNPRQAKRHCGRTQRVIKIPDPAVLNRTAPYLLAQGISRVVIEGALFALPGS